MSNQSSRTLHGRFLCFQEIKQPAVDVFAIKRPRAAPDCRVDEDDCNKCQRFAGSLDKGYHRAELMVYTGVIFDSLRLTDGQADLS